MKIETRLRLIAGAGMAAIAGLGLAAHLSAAEPSKISGLDRKAIEDIVHTYIVAHPEVITEAITALQAKEDAALKAKAGDTIAKHPKDIYEDGYSFEWGKKTAPVTIVEFFDYNCVHCREAFPKLMSLIDNQADVRIIFKEFPIFQGSDEPAAAALAAARQGKYLEMHRALMTYQGRVAKEAIEVSAKKAGLDYPRLLKDMKDPAVQKQIAQNHKLGDDLGLDGTPALIIGKELLNGWSPSLFEDLMKKARAAKGKG